MAEGTLDLIDLVQDKVGYRRFLSCYVYRDAEITFLVDPGPASTIPFLLSSLRELNIEVLDFILLTHVHLDHGGGTAEVLDAFPSAKIFCHEIGKKHVVDPTKLWAGTKQVLGDTALLYGEPAHVPEVNLATEEEIDTRGIRMIPTPGHASHHVSFLVGDFLFAGEAFGTTLALESEMPYLRPATPPKFVLEDALASLDRILALETEPKWSAFAHYGVFPNTFSWARRARKQLIVWVETLRELAGESEVDIETRFFDRIQQIDPLYGRGRFEELPEDIQERERDFLGNTLAGMIGYIRRG